MTVRLRGLFGPYFGKSIDISVNEMLIGREEGCQFHIESGFISRRHCALTQTDEGLSVRDLGSKNGTLVNGNRITGSGTPLRHGDILTIGEFSFQVDFEQAAQLESASFQSTVSEFRPESVRPGASNQDTVDNGAFGNPAPPGQPKEDCSARREGQLGSAPQAACPPTE